MASHGKVFLRTEHDVIADLIAARTEGMSPH